VGTQYGHVFYSNDFGANWQEVSGLFTAPKRNEWGVDWGFGTVGLCIHTISMDSKKSERYYIVSSGGGPYRTEDGGKTWSLLNKGVIDRCPLPDASADVWGLGTSDPEKNLQKHLSEVHKCTHKLVVSREKEGTLYQQNHCGVYRSNDYGENWDDISPDENGRHGFPLALIENGKEQEESVFTIPAYRTRQCKKHNSCIIGELAAYRSQDGGKSWEKLAKGLPKKNHTCVLRDAMATDGVNPAGLYFGTITGEVYSSTDLGQNWSLVSENAGRVQGISAFTI
jgi:BNR/Asp-box repeat